MAKIKVTETELKKIIKESVTKILNEDFPIPVNPQWGQQQNPGNNVTPPMATRQQMDDRAREAYQQNRAANTSLDRWNKLGTVGQIKAIQGLIGAQQDGKMGPQTLGMIFMKLANGQPVKTPMGDIYPENMGRVNWGYGKQGTYKNI